MCYSVYLFYRYVLAIFLAFGANGSSYAMPAAKNPDLFLC